MTASPHLRVAAKDAADARAMSAEAKSVVSLSGAAYNPGVFDVASLGDAQRIILTPEAGRTTDERWQQETPYLIELIADKLAINEASVVLDYGCGIGRVAKALIARFGCRVVGVDISASMRALAQQYVASEKFVVCAPEGLDAFGEGFATAAVAIWVLQHCFPVAPDVGRLRRALGPGGQLLVINEQHRCIPTDRGWMSDGTDLQQLLCSQFDLRVGGRLEADVVTKAVADRTFWAVYARPQPGTASPPVLSAVAAPESSVATMPAAADVTIAASAASEPAPSAPPPAEKRAYPAPAAMPTQLGPNGIRFDFNDGCRVLVPEGDRAYRIRLCDRDTGNILFETTMKGGRVNSTKRYFVRYRVEIWDGDANVLTHDYDATDREVLINFPVGTLGDTMGWFPYAVKFQAVHRCKLTCAMSDKLIPLFRGAYPQIEFVTHEEAKTERYYATYGIGLFFDDKDHVFQPCDFRMVGLHRTAGYILGVDPTEEPPMIGLPDEGRPIAEPYVVIAVQSTTQSKYWNNPTGWREIVRYLKDLGYRVICIDQKPVHGHGLVWNYLPHGAEDETGDRPLAERVRWLRHAEFFIGLSSGLAWLAWAARVPVVLISGFTHPTNEFATPYRVINYHACNSCWNDPLVRFDHKDFLWCPRHKETPRQFECTRLITVDHVKSVIRQIPDVAARERQSRALLR